MTYLLVSRDPKSGLEARIAIPDPAQARRIGRYELDAGRDLLACHATSGEFPVTIEEIVMARSVRAGWRRLQGRDSNPRPLERVP